MKKLLTLCIVHKDGRVLLGMKKRGFGAGKWNGFGGKIEEGETIEEAAAREIEEEAGIKVKNLVEVAVLDLHNYGIEDVFEMYIFKTSDYEGEPREGEEMRPQWFSEDALPYDDSWPDDRHWMPLVLAGKHIKGKFVFGPDNTIVEQHLEEVDKVL
jgi:8-oxo-dGTP diphosphatase / 2-hydroxy-dATP diphosphatase